MNTRYESGFMMPPQTDEQRWVESQRILADMTDMPGAYSDVVGGRTVTAQAGWEARNGRHTLSVNRFMVDSSRRSAAVSYVVDHTVVTGSHRTTDRYMIDPTHGGYEVELGLGETREEVADNKRMLYDILVQCDRQRVAEGCDEYVHYRFERMIAAEAVRALATVPIMPAHNEVPWQAYFVHHNEWASIATRSRLNPAYLSQAAFNALTQYQLMAPKTVQ